MHIEEGTVYVHACMFVCDYHVTAYTDLKIQKAFCYFFLTRISLVLATMRNISGLCNSRADLIDCCSL